MVSNFIRMSVSAPAIGIATNMFGKINLSLIHRFYQSVSMLSNMSNGRHQALVLQAQKQYPGLIGWNNHHIIPIQLAGRLAELGIKIPPFLANITVRISTAYHRLITNEISNQFLRGFDALGNVRAFSVHPANLRSVLNALEKVYDKFPLP